MQIQKSLFSVGECPVQVAADLKYSSLNVSRAVTAKSSSSQGLSPKSLSNEALLRNTQTLVTEERRLTIEILWHLHEIQVRRLYAENGYSSLFEYAVQALGYSEAAAGRRISAMKLLVEIPEIEPALKKGSVSLSTLSTIQGFIQRKDEPVTREEKRELVMALQGKSRRECERELAILDPKATLPKEKERIVSATQTEIRFVADDALMEKLQRIRELDAHVTAGASYLELFHRLADIALKKLDPSAAKESKQKKSSETIQTQEVKPSSSQSETVTPPAELNLRRPSMELVQSRVSAWPRRPQANPRFIPNALKRAVWQRDKSQCSFVFSGGKNCTSKFGLQIDHRVPVARGGLATFDNLRLLCRAHNQYEARIKLGPEVSF